MVTLEVEKKVLRPVFENVWPLHSFALSLVPPPSLSSFPSAGRWRLYSQKKITLTDVIYLPIISIIHITLFSSLFLCPSPSVPLPSPPNFFLFPLHSAQFLPSLNLGTVSFSCSYFFVHVTRWGMRSN